MSHTGQSPDLNRMSALVDQYDAGNECMVKLCVDVVLYYEGGFKANARGVVDFYDAAIELIGPAVTFYNIDGRQIMRKRKRDTLDLLPFWAESDAPARAFYGLRLESGPSPDAMSDRAFRFYDDGEGYVRMMLPLEVVERNGDAMAALATKAAATLRFTGGSGGYAVNMYRGYPSSNPNGHVYAISRRFRGIDFGHPTWLRTLQSHGIKCANWLTFVGVPHLDRLGGPSALQAAFGAGIVVHELLHGVMIQAGPAPSFGDVNRGDKLAAYHAVGRVIEPIRYKQDVFERFDEIGGSENTAEWLARFDE